MTAFLGVDDFVLTLLDLIRFCTKSSSVAGAFSRYHVKNGYRRVLSVFIGDIGK
jgi:hypothetical protein